MDFTDPLSILFKHAPHAVLMIKNCISFLERIFEENHVDPGHGIVHANSVLKSGVYAVLIEREDEIDRLTKDEELSIAIACLLHDADDRKNHKNYENARRVMKEAVVPQEIQDSVIEMISLVSCSTNKNSTCDEPWKLIPRWADRCEAIGRIGILRCYLYTVEKNMPFFDDQTPRATTEEELYKIASKERYQNYVGVSRTMIDHYYDKLLHIHEMNTENPVIQQKAKYGHRDLVEFVLNFGKTGQIDMDFIEKLKQEFPEYK